MSTTCSTPAARARSITAARSPPKPSRSRCACESIRPPTLALQVRELEEQVRAEGAEVAACLGGEDVQQLARRRGVELGQPLGGVHAQVVGRRGIGGERAQPPPPPPSAQAAQPTHRPPPRRPP